MKRWRLSICTLLSVVMLAVSFSVAVDAATISPATINATAVLYTSTSSNFSQTFDESSTGYMQSEINYVAYVLFKIGGALDYRAFNYNAISVTLAPYFDLKNTSTLLVSYPSSTFGATWSTADPFLAIGPYDAVTSVDDLLIGHGDHFSVYPVLDQTQIYQFYAVYPIAGYVRSATTNTRLLGASNYRIQLTYSGSATFNPVTSNDSTLTLGDLNNQTHSLENGYDNSGLNTSNNNLSASINDYDATESQITDSSVANIDAAEFVKPSSNATLLTSISITTTWLQSLFVNLGDWSLLVTISLSLALGLMLIGWFRYKK